VLNADNSQIDCNAKWKRNENPTQPIDRQHRGELFCARGHTGSDQVRIKDKIQNQTQELAAGCPDHTKHERHAEMKQRAPENMRPDKRPPS